MNKAHQAVSCPLCGSLENEFFYQDSKRDYLHCHRCDLVFVPPCFHLDELAQKAQYDLHQNCATDQGYRQFLSRLLIPMLEQVSPQASGLDFGSGPGPTLSLMFEEHGHRMHLYDKFYASDESILQRHYDFITSTEVLEHLEQAAHTLELLWSILLPGGLLGLMTKLRSDESDFAQWHYKNDPTHICFYSVKCFEFLARRWRAKLEISGRDVILLHKVEKFS